MNSTSKNEMSGNQMSKVNLKIYSTSFVLQNYRKYIVFFFVLFCFNVMLNKLLEYNYSLVIINCVFIQKCLYWKYGLPPAKILSICNFEKHDRKILHSIHLLILCIEEETKSTGKENQQ